MLSRVMVKERIEIEQGPRRTCPCFGIFCFLCAFIVTLFGSRTASADGPIAAIRTTSLAAPAATLGLTSPYVIAAAFSHPEVKRPRGLLGLTLSRDLVDFVNRVERLAVYGVELNQRIIKADKLNLRVQSRLGGGVLQLCYRR